MSLGGGGGGSGGTASRKEIIKSEREMLQELERRMVTYETIFGGIERKMINESMGILNDDLIRPMNDEILRVSSAATDAENRLKKLRTQRDQVEIDKKGSVLGIGGKVGGAWSQGLKTIGVDSIYNSVGLPNVVKPAETVTKTNSKAGIVDKGDGWVEELMPTNAGGGKWKLSKKRRSAINEEINEILNAERKLKDLMSERTAAIETQQRNSKLEQTEQSRARVSGVLDTAFAQTGKTQEIRDERYGVDAQADERASDERAKEMALLRAAAAAGARNKAKEDIDVLAKAKLGAIAGADLTDRAAATQLNNLSNSFLSQSAGYADQAAAYKQQQNAATLAAIQGVGSVAGAVVGTGYAKLNPSLSASEKLTAVKAGAV